jgi:hypothetical protein
MWFILWTFCSLGVIHTKAMCCMGPEGFHLMSPTFRQLFVQIDDNTNVSIVRHERQTGVPSQVKSPRIYGDVVNSATKITEMFYSVISTATIADDDFISFPKPTMPFFNMFVFVLGNGVGHDF